MTARHGRRLAHRTMPVLTTLGLAVALAVGCQGQSQPAPEPAPSVDPFVALTPEPSAEQPSPTPLATVRAGSFCSGAELGHRAVTTTGQTVECSANGNERARWRTP